MKANKPLSAPSAVNSDSILSQDEGVLRQIAESLVKSQLYDKAGDVYEKLKDFDKAIEYYKKGDAFGKAIQVQKTVTKTLWLINTMFLVGKICLSGKSG